MKAKKSGWLDFNGLSVDGAKSRLEGESCFTSCFCRVCNVESDFPASGVGTRMSREVFFIRLSKCYGELERFSNGSQVESVSGAGKGT